MRGVLSPGAQGDGGEALCSAPASRPPDITHSSAERGAETRRPEVAGSC